VNMQLEVLSPSTDVVITTATAITRNCFQQIQPIMLLKHDTES